MVTTTSDDDDGAHAATPTTPARRRVTGPPAFVAAHRMADEDPTLVFAEAYALAQLVLHHDGGPVPTTGKRASFPRPVLTALAKRGLVEKHGDSRFRQSWRVDSVRDLTAPTPPAPRYSVTASPAGATEKTRWFVSVTQEGDALVRRHLPESQTASAEDE